MISPARVNALHTICGFAHGRDLCTCRERNDYCEAINKMFIDLFCGRASPEELDMLLSGRGHIVEKPPEPSDPPSAERLTPPLKRAVDAFSVAPPRPRGMPQGRQINKGEAQLLAAAAQAEREAGGPVRPRDVGRRLGWTREKLWRIGGSLVRGGYIAATGTTTDRRWHVVDGALGAAPAAPEQQADVALAWPRIDPNPPRPDYRRENANPRQFRVWTKPARAAS